MKKVSGFTIVELLIVVVVIAILVAITIVSYNGITRQADTAAIKTGLSSVAKKLTIKIQTSGIKDCYTSDQVINTSCLSSSDSFAPLPIKNVAKNNADAIRYYMTADTPNIAVRSASGTFFIAQDGTVKQITEQQYLDSNASAYCGATATYSTISNTWSAEPHYC